jgi:flavin-binding protein dodecin
MSVGAGAALRFCGCGMGSIIADMRQAACPPQLLRAAASPCSAGEKNDGQLPCPRNRCGASAGRLFLQENCMSNHVYKHIELTGSSTKNIEDAVSGAIAKASLSLRNIHWFQVVETRGHVENGKVAHWQVTIKVGFTLED